MCMSSKNKQKKSVDMCQALGRQGPEARSPALGWLGAWEAKRPSPEAESVEVSFQKWRVQCLHGRQ